jgi:hypothetical protein
MPSSIRKAGLHHGDRLNLHMQVHVNLYTDGYRTELTSTKLYTAESMGKFHEDNNLFPLNHLIIFLFGVI